MQKKKMFTKMLYSEISLQFWPRWLDWDPRRKNSWLETAPDWDQSGGKTVGSRPHRYKIGSKLLSIKHVKHVQKTAQKSEIQLTTISRKTLAMAARVFCHRPALLSRSKRAAVSARMPAIQKCHACKLSAAKVVHTLIDDTETLHLD